MSVTERRRHALHEWAKQVGDEEVAATLMELLPPAGWADVATKRDLDQLESQSRAELRAEFAALRTSVSSLEARLHRDLQVQLFAIMGSIWAALGVGLAVLDR